MSLYLITEGLPINKSTKVSKSNNKQSNDYIFLTETSIKAKFNKETITVFYL